MRHASCQRPAGATGLALPQIDPRKRLDSLKGVNEEFPTVSKAWMLDCFDSRYPQVMVRNAMSACPTSSP